jgi:hypothetical protein
MTVHGGRIFGRWTRRSIGTAALVAAIAGTFAHGARASTAPISFAQAPEWITSTQGGYGTDPSSPGPTVRVNVPNAGGGMGFIEVWAKVRSNSFESAVGLFDVTGGHRRFVDGQDTVCSTLANVPLPGDLFMTLSGVPGARADLLNAA